MEWFDFGLWMAGGGLEKSEPYLKKLKFDEPVILNSFQDLTQGTGRDAEPSSA